MTATAKPKSMRRCHSPAEEADEAPLPPLWALNRPARAGVPSATPAARRLRLAAAPPPPLLGLQPHVTSVSEQRAPRSPP